MEFVRAIVAGITITLGDYRIFYMLNAMIVSKSAYGTMECQDVHM